jgi:hypothetical protein
MDQVLEKTILVVVTGILRIHVGEIAVKVVRFYLLLSLHFILQIGFKVVRFYLLLSLHFLLQTGFILLHSLSVGPILRVVILMHQSKLCVCFFRNLRQVQ